MTVPADVLARVHAAAFTDRRSWTAEEFSNMLEMHGMILCGDARSFLLGRVIAGEAEVLTVATDPPFLRQGLARACLREFTHQAIQANAEIIFLEVAEDNTPAKSLYKNEDFRIIGSRPNYYTTPKGAKVSALIMHKTPTA